MKLRLIVVFSLLLVAAVAAWAASSSILYQLPSVAATPICTAGDSGCLGAVVGYTFAGAGSGTNCLPQDPCDGAFTLSLVVTRTAPTDPCHMKTGTGNLNVTWSDSSTTIGTFAFKARDSKTLSVTGQVTGGTNTRFATGSALSGLVATPVDPCVGGPTVGTMTLGQ
jgi:hypothetical protein